MRITNIILVVMSLPAICLGYLQADFDYDGTVDFNDFAAFSSQWLEEDSGIGDGSGGTATYLVASYDAPVHVKARADYVCDGNDDHVEIQAAIDRIGQESPTRGGVVVLPAGEFYPSAAIDLNCSNGKGNYINLWGLSNGIIGTRLDWVDGTNCDGIIYNAGSGLIGDFSLRRLQLINRNDGDYWVVKITADADRKIFDCIFEDVFVVGGGDSSDQSHGGMYIQRDWASHFVRCTFEVSRGVGLQIDEAHGAMFTDCFFAGNGSHGLKIASGTETSIVNCSAHSNGLNSDSFSAYGMYIKAHYSVITNVQLFTNSGWGIYVNGPWSALTNCFAYDNGKGLTNGAWASGGYYIGPASKATVVNCQAVRNYTDTNCFGFFVAASGVNLIGCRADENSKGLYVATDCTDVYLDVQFRDNSICNYSQGSAVHSIFPRRARKVLVGTASSEIEKIDNGTIYIADTTNNNITFTLPEAVVGLEFEFFFSAGANQLWIDPYGSEHIYDDNSSHGAGKYICADEVGESIKLKCIYPGRWEMVDKVGTWTDQP